MAEASRESQVLQKAEVAFEQKLVVTPLAGTLGAKVEGIDLAVPPGMATMARLKELFLEHLVLVFPGQDHLTPDQQVHFAGLWGEIQRSAGMPAGGRDDIVELASRGVGKARDVDMPESQKLARVDIWHSDQSFEPRPPLGSFLLARKLPSRGGDTMFANQYLAFETLSDPIRRMLRGLRALHSGEGFNLAVGRDPAHAVRTMHPIVRRHPETCRSALFVNRIWTRRIEGLNDAESRTVLELLYAQASQPEFTFRHRWTPGDLLMWDNRCTQHYAINDYGAEERVMNRVTVLGDAPAAA